MLGVRKKLSTIQAVKHWHRLRREVVGPHPWRPPRSGWWALSPDGAVGVQIHCRAVGLDDL